MPIDRTDQGASASNMGAKLAHLVNMGAIVANNLPDDAAADTFVAALDPARDAIATAEAVLAAAIAYEAAIPAPRSQKGTDAWMTLRAAIAKATGQ